MKTLSLPCSIWIAATTLVALIAFAGPGDDDRQYAGQQARSIKALDDAEIDTLLNGRGMGLARAAELNHYPGPKHVSSHHLSFNFDDHTWWVHDVGSRNGSLIDGRKLPQEPVRLVAGSRIQAAQLVLTYYTADTMYARLKARKS